MVTLPKEYWGMTRELETVIIQLGRVGDLLNVLPVAKAMFDKTGRRTRIVTHTDNMPILARAPYVEAIEWKGKPDDALGASRMVQALPFDPPGIKIVCGMFFGNMIQPGRHYSNFLIEQWGILGYANEWGKLPLVLQRDEEFQFNIPKSDYVVVSLESYSSPCPVKDQLKALILSACDGVKVVDASRIKLDNFVDMLGLLEHAKALITVDSALIHLNRATETPAILFGKGIEKRWHLSHNVENVHRVFTYEDFTHGNVMEAIDVAGKTIHQLVHRGDAVDNLTVITGGDEAFRPLANLCRQSLDAAGINRVVQFCPLPKVEGKEQSWWKLKAMLLALLGVPHGNWVMWIDADCVVRKGKFQPEFGNFDMMVSVDWNGPCMGIFACRNTDFCRKLLETMLFLGTSRVRDNVHGKNDGPKWEQDCFKTLRSFFPSIEEKVGLLPASFTTDHPQDDPMFKTPVHHWGGRPLNQRLAGMRKDVGAQRKENLIIFCYLPPVNVNTECSEAFFENIVRYPPSYRLIYLSDDPRWKVSRIIPEIITDQDHYKTAGRVFEHVMIAVEDYAPEYFMVIEPDCRVKGEAWDRKMFDTLGNVLVAGTPVAFNTDINGDIIKRKGDEILKRSELPIKVLHDEWIRPDEWALFPNGAFAIYKTQEAIEAWRKADRSLPWDMALGMSLAKQNPDYLDRFGMTPVLSFSCEVWMKRKEMKARLEQGTVYGIHNIKDGWRPE